MSDSSRCFTQIDLPTYAVGEPVWKVRTFNISIRKVSCMGTKEQPRTVEAAENCLRVIEVLQDRNGAGVTEIASELDRSKGTVHSHLTTLLQNEYVVRDGDSYRLSLKFLQLGETVKEEIVGYDITREELEDLAGKTGELAQFATEEHGRAVYLYKVGGEDAVQTASAPGTREHLHCIALGKAMLSHMTREKVDEVIDTHGLKSFTENTITNREELFEELKTIRERGYAFDEAEKIEGIRCVAAPVEANDEIFGAVSVSGPSTRMSGERFREELANMVTRSANVIEINTKFA